MKTLLPAVVGATLALSMIEAGADSTPGDREVALTIESASLATALDKWAQQSGFQIFLEDWEGAKRLTAPSLKGTFSAQAALEQLLKGTQLTYVWLNDKAVSIRKKGPPTVPAARRATGARERVELPRLQLADLALQEERRGGAEDARSARRVSGRPEGEEEVAELEEIVVTGTHIRGGITAAPVLTFDRVAIDQSGYSTVQQFLQSVPQNFSNISDSTFGTINGGGDGALGQASAINLRGLGADATLVLLNGRRLAPSADGRFVDVSLIPLSAVERIDILTDGASAIYGSDAIGGVVNILLKDEFDRAETLVRYGTVSDGGSSETQIGQTFGGSWSSGAGLLSYEYYRRTPLSSLDRSFVENTVASFDLVPEQQRHNVFATVRQDVTEKVQVSGDFLYGRRESDLEYTLFGSPSNVNSELTQYNASLGATIDLNGNWELRAGALYGSNDTTQKTFVSGVSDDPFEFSSSIWSAELTADGSVARIGGGDVRLALGGQFRNEELQPKQFTGITGTNRLKRDIAAAYAEFSVPLVSEANSIRAVRSLYFTAAGRWERYSDFGNSTNPEFGISWKPARGINVRTTYGTSFKAPLLSQVNPTNLLPVAFDMPDDASSAGTPTILLFGSGVDLGPEEATTWTAGIDFSHESGFVAKVTYFDVDFTNRVASPIPDDDRLFTVLIDPTYAAFVSRSPDAALLDQLFARPTFANFSSAISPADIGAIADNRLVNVAHSNLRGIDVQLTKQFASAIGDWAVQINGNYLLDSVRQVLRNTVPVDLLNTVYNPVDLRLRNSLGWRKGSMSANLFVNYTDGYDDRRAPGNAGPGQREKVGSWTTFDLTLGYALEVQSERGLLSGLDLALTVVNAFDRDPPFISSPLGIHFDGANASGAGRFLAFQARKRW